MQVVLIGGGMIASDQILPSLFQLQRLGRIGVIEVCERRAEALERLAASPQIRRAFPDRSFLPRLEPYTEVIAALPGASS